MNDPSTSRRDLLDVLGDTELDYNFDVDCVNPPVIGPQNLGSLCYDVMTTEEYQDERPEWCPGFTVKEGVFTWKGG